MIGLLLAGWLLGLVTAFLWPMVTTQRQTVVVTSQSGNSLNTPQGVAELAADGWIITRTDTIGSTPAVQLERPRYVAVLEQLDEWVDAVGNSAQRLRYGLMSTQCGSGHSANSVDVRTSRESEQTTHYVVSWVLKNDCTAPVVVNRVTITGFRSDGSVLFSFTTSKWQWIEPGYTWWHSDNPGYRGAEHPARVDVHLHYGYTR